MPGLADFFGDIGQLSTVALSPFKDIRQEWAFQKWYLGWANEFDVDPNPDNPLHYYDFRRAYLSGVAPDEKGHWPSQFKLINHPNRYINGIDTITGQPIKSR